MKRKKDREFCVENAIILKAEIYVERKGGFHVGITIGTFDGRDPIVFCMEDCDAEFIRKIMQIAGAFRWKDVFGKAIRVRGLNFSPIYFEIGHIIEDRWLSNYGGEK